MRERLFVVMTKLLHQIETAMHQCIDVFRVDARIIRHVPGWMELEHELFGCLGHGAVPRQIGEVSHHEQTAGLENAFDFSNRFGFVEPDPALPCRGEIERIRLLAGCLSLAHKELCTLAKPERVGSVFCCSDLLSGNDD